MQQAVGRRKIFKNIKNHLGLGKARILACGAAPISVDILNFFGGLDMPIYELSGQSRILCRTTLYLPGAQPK